MSNQVSQLVPSLVAKAMLCLKINQVENGGIVDYERFDEDMYAILGEVTELEYERDECINALKEFQDISKVDFTKWSLS